MPNRRVWSPTRLLVVLVVAAGLCVAFAACALVIEKAINQATGWHEDSGVGFAIAGLTISTLYLSYRLVSLLRQPKR